MNLKLYTDGACSKNGQSGAVGGWAFLIIDGEDDSQLKQGFGCQEDTTNQQMELTAIIMGLAAVSEMDFFFCEVLSDSAYCVNAVNDRWIDKWRANGWLTSKNEPVKNRELWEQLYSLYTAREGFKFTKVKGHSGDKWNEKVDTLAVRARTRSFDF